MNKIELIIAAGAVGVATVGASTVEHLAHAAQQPQGIVRHGEFGQGYQGSKFIVPGTETQQAPREIDQDTRAITHPEQFGGGGAEVRCPTTAQEAEEQLALQPNPSFVRNWEVRSYQNGSFLVYEARGQRQFSTGSKWESAVYPLIRQGDNVNSLGRFSSAGAIVFQAAHFMVSCFNRPEAVTTPTATPLRVWNPGDPLNPTTPTSTPGVDIVVAPGAGQPPLP